VRLETLLAAANLRGAGVPVLDVRGDPAAAEVKTMTLDSRAVAPGALYCCVPGRSFDGHDFAPVAVQAGAVALLCQRPLEVPVPQVIVPSVRSALGPLADALYDHPSQAMTVVGITGTNGKTTTTHLLAAVFEAAGWHTATLGTLSGIRTTPEAPDLQATLAELRRGGVGAVAMEVSSHALSQHRVDAVHFAAATFTNLTQDHLDYHQTMEQYFSAKADLFANGRAEIAVVNGDDPWGRRLLTRLEADGRRVVTFSLADAEDVVLDAGGSRFRWDGVDLTLRLGGRFNIANALAAATTARTLGVPRQAIADGLVAVSTVRGRFEPVDAGQPFTVLVDYAHTPAALEEALVSARELIDQQSSPGMVRPGMVRPGKLIVVFGCGGDRDPTKRPLMGAVATRLADLVVLTSDNPRGEDPQRILDDVRAGVGGPGQLVVEPDRARAISQALFAAAPRDGVVIAGKGHESGQEIGGRTVPFDDVEVATAILERRAGGPGRRSGRGCQSQEPECSPS
jgi:UDP-N-acetylmuramoyl-L-alanyl-D-glutamate--2,6-diaminopimelate ligase